MEKEKKIRSALISVYHKDNLEPIIRQLHKLEISIYATGGTQEFIEALNIPVIPVEEVTDYPSILGGRVKTLHPKIFGGILSRREHSTDQTEIKEFEIPEIDLVIVDLYPFEETVATSKDESQIIEKIDIGGISLIRAAAKNFNDVVIIPAREYYSILENILKEKKGISTLQDRRSMAAAAFDISSNYDTAIFNFFNKDFHLPVFKKSLRESNELRYGENPHQKGRYFGDFSSCFDQLNGKEISYNNLLDIDAAVNLGNEFEENTVIILKHNNACGVASRKNLYDAWKDALAGDPVSAFGGIIWTNAKIDKQTAILMDQLFFEIVIAPDFESSAIDILKKKKNRILLRQKVKNFSDKQFRSILNGVVEQDRDNSTDSKSNMKTVTKVHPTEKEYTDLTFASKICKHTKSNTIVIAKNEQLLGSGTGQTSRVDALQQAIAKAKHFGFDLNASVMASDAFFPFPDCVEIASKAGIKTIIQPGGSIKDQESIDYCNEHQLAMVTTGFRHFKH